MGWIHDEQAGVLEYHDRRGERVHRVPLSGAASPAATLDLLFHAAASPVLTDEDVGRLLRLLASWSSGPEAPAPSARRRTPAVPRRRERQTHP